MQRPTPPYVRIAEQLKRRLATQAPGTRVPSTRQITEQFGVAMATATRVLAALQKDGLVRVVPGVGTVVAEKRASPRRTEAELTREAIVTAAMRVADTEGLAAVSMRRIALEIGVSTMALYRHVPGKDELVTLMADEAIAEEPLPNLKGPWRARLEELCRVQWRGFRRRPWLARAISLTRPQAMPKALVHTEAALEALRGHGLDAETMLYAYLTLFGYVRGVAVSLEAEREAEQDTGLDAEAWLERNEAPLRAAFASGAFPHTAEMAGKPIDFDLDALFEFGLQRLLDGIGAMLRRR